MQAKLKHSLAATLSAEQALEVAEQARKAAELERSEAGEALYKFQVMC